jgi:NCS1 family nucleobase:cation symporter-1
LGACIQTAFSGADTMTGTASVALSLAPWFRVVTLLTLIIGLANIGAFNIYGAMMSSLTIVTSVVRRLQVGRMLRISFLVALASAGGAIAAATSDDFLHAYEDFIFFIITFLIPWSSINLVDYYWIRGGRYDAADLFTPLAQYGTFNGAGIISYVLGCLCQIPFISQEFYTGAVAGRLGFDVAWVVGLIVPGGIYYWLARRPAAAIPASSSTSKGPR